MWVRSQNKEVLCDCTLFYISQSKVRAESAGGTNIMLGEYESTERALQVLHAIQQAITYCTKEDEICQGKRITSESVFQMPEK